MEYIVHKEKFFINRDIGDPIVESSFLVEIVETEGSWIVVPSNTIHNFSRYIDGTALSGSLTFLKKFKIKSKEFKGLE